MEVRHEHGAERVERRPDRIEGAPRWKRRYIRRPGVQTPLPLLAPKESFNRVFADFETLNPALAVPPHTQGVAGILEREAWGVKVAVNEFARLLCGHRIFPKQRSAGDGREDLR